METTTQVTPGDNTEQLTFTPAPIGNCEAFMELSPQEQANYLGSITIAVQRSPGLYQIGLDIIAVAHGEGIYNRAKTIPHEALSLEAKLDITNPIEQ